MIVVSTGRPWYLALLPTKNGDARSVSGPTPSWTITFESNERRQVPPPWPISNSKSLPTELRSFAIIRTVNELARYLPELSVCLMNVSSSFLVQHQRLPNWSPWSCCLHSPPCHFLASVSNFLGSRKHSIPHGDFLWQHKMVLLNERRVRGGGHPIVLARDLDLLDLDRL